MLTRTAIYEGTIQAGKENEFFARVRDELEPLWRRFPNVTAVRVQRRLSADDAARPIPMILEMDFPDQKAIDDCLASSIRPESHAKTLEVMKLFEGTFYHYVMERPRCRPPFEAAPGADRGRLDAVMAAARCTRRDGARLHTVAANPLLSFPGRLPLTGGQPLVHAGDVVGGAGSSGGSPDEDVAVCAAAVAAPARLARARLVRARRALRRPTDCRSFEKPVRRLSQGRIQKCD